MADQKTHRKSTRKIGDWGEAQARSYLESLGFEILAQNVTTEYGEIDVVARKEGCCHFVEVKTRRTRSFGLPEEAVTERKLRHMIESAQSYIQTHPELESAWQIDVLALQVKPHGQIEIQYFENVQ